MVDQYLVTEDEAFSVQWDDATGELFWTRQNGQQVRVPITSGLFASKATQATVETGRLSEAELSATIAAGSGYDEVRRSHERALLTFNALPLAAFRDAVARSASSPVVVVAAGDSVTEGWNATEGNAWPDQLAKLLASAFPSRPYAVNPVQRVESATVPTGPGVHVVNAGVAGTVSNTYLTPTSRAQVMALKPSLVIHQVGFNDWRNSVTPASYKSRVRDQINALKALQDSPCAHLLVLAYEQWQPHGPAGWWEYGRALAEVAAEFSDVAYVDYSGAFNSVGVPDTDPLGLIDSDNLHATDAGHRLIALVIADTLGVRVSPDPNVYAADSFAGLPGGISYTEQGGKPWVDLTPTLANYTRGGGTLTVSKIGSGSPFAIVEAAADGKISATFKNATYEGLLFRFSDTSNHWLVTISSSRYRLFKREANVLTEVASTTEVLPASGHRIDVTLDGPAISVAINGTPDLLTASDSFNQTKTQCGFWVGSGAAQTVGFGDFRAVRLSS